MVDVQQIIEKVRKVIGDVRLPCRISIIDNEGLEIYSTQPSETVKLQELGATDVLGMLAFEQLRETVKKRKQSNEDEEIIDTLIFMTNDNQEHYISPINEELFLTAVSTRGKIASMVNLLQGLRSQIIYSLQSINKEGSS